MARVQLALSQISIMNVRNVLQRNNYHEIFCTILNAQNEKVMQLRSKSYLVSPQSVYTAKSFPSQFNFSTQEQDKYTPNDHILVNSNIPNTTSTKQCFPTPASSKIKLPLPFTKLSHIPESESDSEDEENDYRDVVNIQDNQNLAAYEAVDEEGEILNIFQDQINNIDNFNEEENLPSRSHSQLSSENDSPSRPSSDQELENQAVQLPPAIDQPAEQFHHEDQVNLHCH